MCSSDPLRLPPAYSGTCVLGANGSLRRLRSPSTSGSDETLICPARVLNQTPYGSLPTKRSFEVCFVCPQNWATRMNATPHTTDHAIRSLRYLIVCCWEIIFSPRTQ